MSDSKIKTTFSGVALLLITAIIWGISFVSQGEGAKLLQPFSFNGIRTILGAIVLVPVILIKDFVEGRSMSDEQKIERKKSDKKTLVYGSLIGIALCIATNFQQYAFDPVLCPDASAGKIAFITAMYMFLVPVMGLFIGKRVSLITWICVFVSIAGLYFLCIDGTSGFGSITKGDVLALICAFFFSFQILMIEKFAPDVDGVKLSCVQFFVSGIITCILMFIFENPVWANVKAAAIPILYSGLMSCGVAYTFQILGQKRCEATVASLLMCLESVFAALSEAAFFCFFSIGNKILTGREVTGCAIMFIAILISQIGEAVQNGRKSDR